MGAGRGGGGGGEAVASVGAAPLREAFFHWGFSCRVIFLQSVSWNIGLLRCIS